MYLSKQEIAELAGAPEPDHRVSYYCPAHDEWGKHGEYCISCDAELIACHETGAWAPYDEWVAAQKAVEVLKLREKLKVLEDELQNTYEFTI